MSSGRYILGAITVAAACASLARGDTPHYLSSREIVLDCRPANGVEVTGTELWVSTDGGRNWWAARDAQIDGGVVRFTASKDGRYDFFVILKNRAGASSEPPQPGSRPVASAVVDTTGPLLQLHRAVAEATDDGQTLVALDVTLVEENLSADGLRVFYRKDSDDWTDGGTAKCTGDSVAWLAKGLAGARLDLRLVAADLAGNRCTAELPGVALPAAGAESKPSEADRQKQTSTAVAGQKTGGVQPVEPPTIAPVRLPSVKPVVLGTADGDREDVTPAADVANLRRLAARFMAEGRYALAAARFEDALRATPRDADLLVDLGSALYRVGRYDEAERRFESALSALPDHIGAIEGLALVAATEKRYPQAREHMVRLQRLQPESGSVWLRSGDIEHRLGNGAAALEAWRRVLDLPGSDEGLRAKARRRLDYFGTSAGSATPAAKATDSKWHRPAHVLRSSSSTGTNPTSKTPS